MCLYSAHYAKRKPPYLNTKWKGVCVSMCFNRNPSENTDMNLKFWQFL